MLRRPPSPPPFPSPPLSRPNGHADLIEPYGGSAADVEQQPLLSRLHQRRSAKPVGGGEWHARPEQRHLEVLRPDCTRICRRRKGETDRQDRQASDDAHVAPPCVRRWSEPIEQRLAA